MLTKEVYNSLKIPEYCIKRRNVKGGVEHDNPEVHKLTDEYWDSPKITPNFGDENDYISHNITINRVPRIYSLAENESGHNLDIETKFHKQVMKGGKESSAILSDIITPTDDYSENKSDYDDDYDDILTPFISSAARYRLYEIDWDEKLRLNKGVGNSKSTNEYDEIKPDNISFRLLDSIGIKGPKEFETQQGKVVITENGDFSFEFSERKKMFTIKGGGCFVVVRNVMDSSRTTVSSNSLDSSEIVNQQSQEIIYHISELPQHHLKRYLYGIHLCETIKSFIPRVKLKVPQEGTYFLMSNHLTFADFRVEFSSTLSNKVISAHLTKNQSKIIFTSKNGYIIEFEKHILDKMGVYEEVDKTFEEMKYKDYISNKSREISDSEMNWSIVINIWRLMLNRLIECKQLEIKGLKTYSDGLICTEVDRSSIGNNPNQEINVMDWSIKKSIYDGIFPIQIEKIY
ncbi:hypothetical protein OIY81_378 [Cryptosporidium canis]|nr:hypothetical protein OIY81_378 [Cryptosporidium canis]